MLASGKMSAIPFPADAVTATAWMRRGESDRPDGKKRFFIYALIDPETQLVRYIGCTEKPIERSKLHYSAPLNDEIKDWLFSLRSKGLAPRLVTLRDVRANWPPHSIENLYIYEYRRNGAPLLNRRDMIATHHAHMWERWAARWRKLMLRAAYAEVRHLLPPRKPGTYRNGPSPLSRRVIEAFGKRQNMAAWARELGISREAVRQRLKKHPPEIALAPKERKLAALVA